MNSSEFADAWPGVEAELRRSLWRCGVDVDDLVQDVGARAVQHMATFRSDEHLVRWSHVAARNILIDRARRGQTITFVDLDAALALPDAVDVEGEVEGRTRLRSVLDNLSALRPAELRAVLRSIDGYRQQPGEAVLLHRARAKLERALRPVLLLLPRMTPGRSFETVSAAAAIAALLLGGAAVLRERAAPTPDARAQEVQLEAGASPGDGDSWHELAQSALERASGERAGLANPSARPDPLRPVRKGIMERTVPEQAVDLDNDGETDARFHHPEDDERPPEGKLVCVYDDRSGERQWTCAGDVPTLPAIPF